MDKSLDAPVDLERYAGELVRANAMAQAAFAAAYASMVAQRVLLGIIDTARDEREATAEEGRCSRAGIDP